MADFDRELEAYCRGREDSVFVDFKRCPFLYSDPAHVGELSFVRDDLFIEDRVHFNAEGYRLFKGFMLDVLGGLL
jgi:lysophospholipase L1-like esterase